MISDAQRRLAHHEEAVAWKLYRQHCTRAARGNRRYAAKAFEGDATSHELWRTWSAGYERMKMFKPTRARTPAARAR